MCTFRSFWELWGIFCHKCSSWDASFDKLSPNFPPEVLSSECMKSVLCFLSFRQPPSVQGVSGVWSPIINTTVTSCWARLQPLAFKCLHGRMTAAGIIKSLRVIGALKGLPGFPLSARFFQSDQGGQNVLILAECMDFSVKMGNRWKKRKSFGMILFFLSFEFLSNPLSKNLRGIISSCTSQRWDRRIFRVLGFIYCVSTPGVGFRNFPLMWTKTESIQVTWLLYQLVLPQMPLH